MIFLAKSIVVELRRIFLSSPNERSLGSLSSLCAGAAFCGFFTVDFDSFVFFAFAETGFFALGSSRRAFASIASE
jgi:hypothetical protein